MPMYGDLGNKLVLQAKRTQNLPHLPPYQTDLVRAVTREVRDLDRDVAALLEPFQQQQSGEDDDDESLAGGRNGATQSSFDPARHQSTACALLVDHLSMRRNKRCLLAYHRTRTDRLEELVWAGVDVLDLGAFSGGGGGGGGGGDNNKNNTGGGLGGGNSAGRTAAAAAAGGNGSSSNSNNNNNSSNGSSLSPHEEDYVRQYGDLLAAVKGQWTDIDLTGSLEPPRDLFIDVRVLKDAGEIQTEYGAINLTKNSQFYVRQGDVERLVAQGYLQKLG